MTINSTTTTRTLSVKSNTISGLSLKIFEGARFAEGVINVTPEDFAREITEANIPGLTVTYEKPAPPLPTDPGWYAARDDIDSGRMYGVLMLGNDGEWQSRASAEHWHHNRGGLVPMIPAKDADL